MNRRKFGLSLCGIGLSTVFCKSILAKEDCKLKIKTVHSRYGDFDVKYLSKNDIVSTTIDSKFTNCYRWEKHDVLVPLCFEIDKTYKSIEDVIIAHLNNKNINCEESMNLSIINYLNTRCDALLMEYDGLYGFCISDKE